MFSTRAVPRTALLAAICLAAGSPDRLVAQDQDHRERTSPAEPAAGIAELKPEILTPQKEVIDTPVTTQSELTAAPNNFAEPEPAFLGYWSKTKEGCEATGRDGPFEISREYFSGYGDRCVFTAIAEDGLGWSALVKCPGSDDEKRLTLASDRNFLRVVYHDLSDQNVTYFRCVPRD